MKGSGGLRLQAEVQREIMVYLHVGDLHNLHQLRTDCELAVHGCSEPCAARAAAVGRNDDRFTCGLAACLGGGRGRK